MGLGEFYREAEGELLNTLAALPEQLKNPINVDEVDEDLRPATAESVGNGDKDVEERRRELRERYNARRRERRTKAKEA